MPEVTSTRCSDCGVAFPAGWGGYTYAVAEDGTRVACLHPVEFPQAEKVTGMKWGEAQARGRVGFSSYCMCFACGRQFDLDLDRDVKRCPGCGSLEILSARGALGRECPHCHRGVFREESTGLYS